ncbi:MAG: 30S ribosomal protein S1 [Elusimicrobia bacterium]|nr:30S ribosomal protein S1 [Elusimicrobiota bacterium]
MTDKKLSMEDVVRQMEDIQQERMVIGRVIEVDRKNNNVLVDIGYKSEGVIPLHEFKDEEIKVGDEVEVFIVKKSMSYEYPPVLSHKRAQVEHRLDEIEKAFTDNLVIDAKLEKKVKGGLIVDIGDIKAFMPASLVGYPMVKNLDSVIDKTVPSKIIEFDRKNKNIIVSWRKAIEEDVRRKREELYEQLYPGKTIKGRVSGIKTFGAFIDLGGIDGLLHISELSWGHVDKVEDIVKVGDEIEVKIKSFNPKSNKISLSLKETQPHPWENIESEFKPGDVIDGKVTGVTSYGAFVELKPGVEGLIKTEEISWTENVKHPGDKLAVNDAVKIKIIEIDLENKKIALSLKQVLPNPWEEVDRNYQVGNIIEGKITHTTDFGAFVMLNEGVEGLIHVSDMTWDKEVEHPSEFVQVGDTVKVKILSIEPDKQKLSLGLKQLEDNPYNDYPAGSTVKCYVKTVQRSGAYVEMENGLEGYMHISNFSRERTEDLREKLKEGDVIEHCRVIKNNPSKKVLEVSIKDYEIDMEHREMKKYMDPSESSGATLRDLIGDKLKGLADIDKKKDKE